MSRQYFSELIQDPITSSLAAITTTSAETAMWNVAQFTPIHAFDAYRGAGKIYRMTAGGTYSTTGAAAMTLTPRFGTSSTSTSLGPSAAFTMAAGVSTTPWRMQFELVVRTLGAPGVNSTVIGIGQLQTLGTASSIIIGFGASSTTVDLSVESGIWIGLTMTSGYALTPMYAFIQSLN